VKTNKASKNRNKKSFLATSNHLKSHHFVEHSVGIGTPTYMAPEQSKGEGRYNNKADMYSLGILFFEMWAGFKTRFERDKAINMLK
jgi:translation initiation factor 2-alpha kinase 4